MIVILSVIGILIPIVYSIYTGYQTSKEIKSSRDFFLFHEGLVPAKLRNSITASNASLASAIFSFLVLGYSFKVAAIVSPITWLAGFFILIWVYPKIKDLASRTLHGYLSFRYGTKTIGYIASIASIIGFLGAYGIELLVSIKITSVLFPAFPPIVIAIVLSVIVAAYTALGGFKAATQLDSFRFYLTLSGLAVVFGFSYYLAYTNRGSLENLQQVISRDNYGFSNLTLLFLVSLAVLNIPWQLVDMSLWQKLVACESVNDIKKGLRQSIWAIGILWTLLIILGLSLNFFPNFIAPENGDFAALFLTYLKNPIVFAFFAMGCFAAMMSTADSLLIASVQTLAQDVLYPHKDSQDLVKPTSDNTVTDLDKNILSFGRRWVFILGIASPIIIYLINLIIPGILDLFFLIYCAQLTLLVSVCVAIFSKNPKRFKTIAIVSISIGLLAAFGMFIKMLLNPSMETFLWAPIISVAVSIIPWGLSPIFKSK